MQNLATQVYYDVEEKFFNNLKDRFGGNLLFYCVSGSVGRKEPIPNWSDIDIVFICKNWSKEVFTALHDSLNLNKSGIKIGTTFYVLDEFNSYKFQDPKTLNLIYNIHRGRYSPKLHNVDVILKHFDIETIFDLNVIEFNKTLHSFKRELSHYPEFDERFTYRSLRIMLRILLMKNGLMTDGYEEVFATASKVFDDLPCSMISVKEIMEEPEKQPARYEKYINFLVWLEKKYTVLKENKYDKNTVHC